METFLLYLSTPSATGTLARAVGHVTIVDNDNTVATPRLFVRDALVDETIDTESVRSSP
jgi:hypothetical protein